MAELQIIGITCAVVGLCTVFVMLASRLLRRKARSVDAGGDWVSPVPADQRMSEPPVAPGSLPATPAPLITSEGAIRALSERLAALEGTLPALRTQIESYAAMAQRLAALEANIPQLADSYERFSDAIDRKEKRDGERDRRGRKKETQTAGEAAAEFGLPGPLGSGPGAPAANVPGVPLNNGPTRRLVGKGRARKAN